MTTPPGSNEPERTVRHSDVEIAVVDSVTEVRDEDTGRVVVTGSHGGRSSGTYALAVRASLYVFNDAGIGKGEAGVAALAMLDEAGIAAIAVGCDTARIGDARDTLSNGIVTRTNARADALGCRAGDPLPCVIDRLAGVER